jgi:hypothetical protein
MQPNLFQTKVQKTLYIVGSNLISEPILGLIGGLIGGVFFGISPGSILGLIIGIMNAFIFWLISKLISWLDVGYLAKGDIIPVELLRWSPSSTKKLIEGVVIGFVYGAIMGLQTLVDASRILSIIPGAEGNASATAL